LSDFLKVFRSNFSFEMDRKIMDDNSLRGEVSTQSTEDGLSNSLSPKWLMELTPYQGELSLDENAVPVSFRAGITLSGELVIDLDPIPLSDRSKFIVTQWDRDPARFVHFGLTGVTDNNMHFKTSDLFFTTLGSIFHHPITPKAQCSEATITWKLDQPVERPLLRMKVKAFRCLKAHDVICPLGQVAMTGQHTIEDADFVTGSFEIVANGQQSDPVQWREQAERLLERVRRVMSFASSTVLRNPIQEFYVSDAATITCYSQSRSSLSGYPIIHHRDTKIMFEAAVHSFFKPPVPGSDLHFAIEWLSMDASYNEVRLVTAMTALENLLDANLARISHAA
jgi:hypothetical protein